MLRRLTRTAAVSLASLAVLSAAAPAATAAGSLTMPIPPLPSFQHLPLFQELGGVYHPANTGQTRLTVTVSSSGDRAADGTFELECGPTGGSHPQRQGACDRLAEAAKAGEELFAPTPQDAMCTQMDGGPAGARIVGTWQGQRVDTSLSRANGCEISRWNNLVPVLPTVK
ncbi:SSI family serine proteinase inhibitor [Streptomyces sp. BE308]|uniref:SSI family serine proteinase inhibitor n=1 Tax=Streptomyces sp. BE308 TaxID=3002529 RepID=UPI002E766B59|nr:SSI family serine proteinase inhibitor [Streptomyces sp. BE308]MEE1794971.1 SSI family serine proteinase inhibitor [Streptomyces sp. BE308]